MDIDRKAAVTAGALFLIADASCVPAFQLLQPLLHVPDYLSKIPVNANQISFAALLILIMAAACAGIAISMYPVLRKFHPGLALGSVGFRVIEASFQIAFAVGLLSLLTLSQQFVKAGPPEALYFQAMGALLLSGNAWVGDVAMLWAWCIGAFMYYYVLFRTGLVPRWLSGWGLLGIALSMALTVFVMFRLVDPNSAVHTILNLPIALQEIVLAVWLIAKGFNPSVIDSEPSKKGANEA